MLDFDFFPWGFLLLLVLLTVANIFRHALRERKLNSGESFLEITSSGNARSMPSVETMNREFEKSRKLEAELEALRELERKRE